MGSTTERARFVLGRVPLNHEYIRLGGFVLTMQSEPLKVEIHVVLKIINPCNQESAFWGGSPYKEPSFPAKFFHQKPWKLLTKSSQPVHFLSRSLTHIKTY